MATRMLKSTVTGGQVIRHIDNTVSSAGYQECGLTGKTGGTATGLATTTQYYFKVNKDGTGVVEVSITTASDVTYTAVMALMNTAMAGQLSGAVWAISGGDLRCTSNTLGTASSIALAAGTTGTNLFATLTGFTAFDTAVAGDGPDEDPWGKAIIPSTGASLTYPLNGAASATVQVFGETSVTGTPSVDGCPGGSGPWSVIQTVTNPTTTGTIVTVPAGVNAVRITPGSYTGGPLRATLNAKFGHGGLMW